MPEQTQTPALEQYILDHLNEALERGYVKVYCQPVIRTLSRQVCGMEALARWEDPQWGLLTPDKFIGVLEKHRRIHELDSYIIRQVCLGYRKAMRRDAVVPISINLSRLDYELCDIFEVVESAVRANMVPRSYLCIEITESILNSNETLMRRYIDRFQSAGYQVWMDDFGSGYSSLNVLKDYRFDELKIDMRFLSDFHLRSQKILASIVHMAKEIGIQTLAEGVETEEQFQFLRNIGCEKVQGYLFGKPLPYRECLRHVERSGLAWEPPILRKYYDDLGGLDVLSAAPFLAADDRKELAGGRGMNSIPLALLELREKEVQLRYTNLAFDETASGIDWKVIFGVVEGQPVRHESIPLGQLSTHLRRLLEETRASGKGKMYFVYNDEYYEMQAKRISAYDDICGILLRMDNLSRGAEVSRQRDLDQGLRQIYSIYDRVSLVDLKAGTATPLYLDSREEKVPLTGDLETIVHQYATEWIFPEDRERFLTFLDSESLERRVVQEGKGYISIHLRTRTYHGAYIWKCYTMVRIREGIYYMLVRDTQAEIREFQIHYGALARPAGEDGDPITPALLWANVTQNSDLKFFWKDKNRKFKGASRSFLDFYGFRSLKELLGKTDEDMGWHLHPDLYRDSEWNVIREGAVSRNVPGTCIVRGENRNIIASKMPLYDSQGDIVGLIGFFSQVGDGTDGQDDSQRTRLDSMTGLLNSRGLDEDLYAYRDEYELRGKDFARIDVAIEDFAEINQRYGYDFGDSVIRAVGSALLQNCGSTATVGRPAGYHFLVLSQFETPADLDALVERIRGISAEIQTVDGIPFTVYLSVGVAVYSEAKDMDKQADEARLRRLADDVERASRGYRPG